MNNVQAIADRSAIGLSMLCALHCLLLPLAIVLYPSSTSVLPDDELVHLSILFIVIPISIFALLKGAHLHKNRLVFLIGLFGLLTLILALIIGHDLLGTHGEKIFTLVGSLMLIVAHFRNFSICRQIYCEYHSQTD